MTNNIESPFETECRRMGFSVRKDDVGIYLQPHTRMLWRWYALGAQSASVDELTDPNFNMAYEG